MTEFRIINLFDAPFTAIRKSMATIRNSPPKDIYRQAVGDLEGARKEVSAFLDSLGGGTNLVRIIPRGRDGTSSSRYITGEFRSIFYDSPNGKLNIDYREYQTERSVKEWKKETLAIEGILQIQIWEVVRNKGN